MTEFRFADAVKDPAEDLPVELVLFPMAAAFWRANERFDLSEYVRPLLANGFAYQATTAGTSAGREPRWPTTVGETVVDGSVTWTCAAAGANGVSTISSPSAASSPTGLTIASIAVVESCKITATYQGGIDGQSYDVAWTFTLSGASRVARQRVRVMRR